MRTNRIEAPGGDLPKPRVLPFPPDSSGRDDGPFVRMIQSSSRVPATLVEHARAHAAERPRARGFTWLRDGELEDGALTFAELDAHARKVAAHLEALGLRGERALLLYPPGLEFIAAFVGCLYAGVVAVPMNTPRNERAAALSLDVARHAAPAIWLTHSSLADAAWTALEPFASRRRTATDLLPLAAGERWSGGETDPDALAFVQYTSGSTGAPKGVQVSHRNLVRNEEMIRAGMGHDASTVFVNWLPLFHDMGLVGNVLQPLFLGVESVLMAPTAFVQKPVRWLKAITRYRGTTAGGPNFGYELCAQRVRPEQLEGLDLSSWKVAYNGSEPVRASTLERFAATFAPAGFRRASFYPCYGLAEAALFVTGGVAGEPHVVRHVDGEALKEHRVRAAPSDDPGARALVGCGRTWLDQRVLVVDPDTRRALEDGAIGELWLQGENVARGYRELPADEEDPFAARLESGAGPFLRTGDLGFLDEGELFVTGRIKDVVIQNGENHYPQDLEHTASTCHPALRADQAAAFAVEADDVERLVVVQEVRRAEGRALEAGGPEAVALRAELVGAVRAALSARHGLHAWRVVLIRQGSLPRTSSGKVQRQRCRALWSRAALAEHADRPNPERSRSPHPRA